MLNKQGLIVAIDQMLNVDNKGKTPQEATLNQATMLANAIENFIKSGMVNVTVAVAVDPASHAGTGTGTGTVT